MGCGEGVAVGTALGGIAFSAPGDSDIIIAGHTFEALLGFQKKTQNNAKINQKCLTVANPILAISFLGAFGAPFGAQNGL